MPLLRLLILLLLPLAAQAADNPIAARLDTLTAAYNAGDFVALAAIYAEDGVLLPPEEQPVSGRAAIATHFAAAANAGVGNMRYRPLEIRAHGPAAAVEIGETLVDFKGGTIRGRSLHVWVLLDGQWWLSRDIYHTIGLVP
jgi:uncharacterized protein (TIGR02246 family)